MESSPRPRKSINHSSIKGADDFSRQVLEFAKIVQQEAGYKSLTPYKTDKMTWLLCTCNFYKNTNLDIQNPDSAVAQSLLNVLTK